MLYKIVLATGAEEDIDNAYNWYEDQQTGLGERFLKELVVYYKKIAQNPEIFSIARDQYRQAVLAHFPYVIIYEITNTQVHIYSVFHTSRNPKVKYKKK